MGNKNAVGSQASVQGDVRYMNILTWLPGFQDKLSSSLVLVLFSKSVLGIET